MMGFAKEPRPLDQVTWRNGEIGDATDIHRQVWSVEIKGGQNPMVRHGSEKVRAVRVVKEGRLGYATSRTQPWIQLKQEAMIAASHGPETKMDEPVISSRKVPVAESQWCSAMFQQIYDAASALYDDLENLDHEFRPSVMVAYHETATNLSNSTGGHAAWTHGYWDVSAGGRKVSGTDFHGIAETRLGADAIPDVNQVGQDLAKRFLWGQNLQSVDSGKYPIVFLPPVTMGLLASVLARLSGPALIAGNSPWEDQREQPVLSSLLSILSDAVIPDGPRTGPFDDEGTATGTWPLIEQGVLKNFVLDRDAARRLGFEPLGMGYRAAPNALPMSLPANLVISPGMAPLAEMLTRFPRLLILNGWIGGRPTNPLRGDISGNASDLYYVDHGFVTGRVKNAVVSVNVFDALSHQLLEVGQEVTWATQGMMQAAPGKFPPLLIDQVDVAVRH